ncbi:MAG: NAD(P)/FAD-dependent oxidoreductase [Planctomycetota bacterium]
MSYANTTDIAVIGAGAAGLMAAIFAARTNPGARVIAFDGARTLGAKILVAGGGRCNVTHHAVDESAYAGSSRNAIKKVLRRFDVEQTVAFFNDLGVELKREETGKLFPTTDKARTVLDALLNAARDAGAHIEHPWRVGSIEHRDGIFTVTRDRTWEADAHKHRAPEGGSDTIHARRVILATGGKALPKTGSDGAGYAFARTLGHTVSQRVFPALVPLVVDDAAAFLRDLSGIACDATLEARSSTNKRLASFTGSTLCTHFGLSGPAPLDISRYFRDAQHADPGSSLLVNWLPGETVESIDRALLDLRKRSPMRFLCERLPERLARTLCDLAHIDAPNVSVSKLTRQQRTALARACCEMVVPVRGDRGFAYAEVTAGGVPLSEINLKTMESRATPGLHLIGEICDVDGRIGGFNFQWAWASGYIAGINATTPSRATSSTP